MLVLKVLLLLLSLSYASEDHLKTREYVIRNFDNFFGKELRLNALERNCNHVLMKLKMGEIKAGQNGTKMFPSSKSFNVMKTSIENSQVFRFIRTLPKGGTLQNALFTMATPDYIYNLTLVKGLYGCYVKDKLRLRFMRNVDNSCSWQDMETLRKNPQFDPWFKTQLTFTFNAPRNNSNVETLIKPILTFKPVFIRFVYSIMKNLLRDNIQYTEIRSELPDLYDQDGAVYDKITTARILKEVIETFTGKNPKFIGAKLIFSPSKTNSKSTMTDYFRDVKSLKKEFGTFLAGFDLVGGEEVGKPLSTFYKRLGDISEVTELMLRAGETRWVGNKEDMNLIEAVLLGSRRIGHGFSLTNHLELTTFIKNQRTAIEISPISNQISGLIQDLRNHPAKYLMANNIPVVIGNEHTGLVGGSGTSYDWYLVFMAMVSENAGLGFLKRMAMNSLEFSAMNETEMISAFDKWEENWNDWLLNYQK